MGNANNGAAANRGDRRGDNSTQERGVKKCVTLKNHASIRKETIKLVPSADGQSQELQLVFDSNYECMITVYLCATEVRNAQSTPLFYYTDTSRHGAPNAYKFSPGLKQKLPAGICRLDLSQYQVQELTHYREDFYPCVIAIESIFPDSYKGRAKKSIQFSLGAFALESGNVFRFKLLKQKLLYNKTIFELTDMYGKENASTSQQADDSQRECVICFTVVKDTVVLPCRHLCLCQGCSQIVRMQNNTCPICRTRIESFMHIKFKEEENNRSVAAGEAENAL